MDSHADLKRRKLEDRNGSPKQVDAHIKTFLESLFKKSDKSYASENVREALASVVSKTLRKRRSNVPRRDAFTQTEDESEDQVIECPPLPPSPTTLLTENAAAYYASAENNCYFVPPNADIQCHTSNSTHSTAGSQIPSAELRQQLIMWDRSYQQWFRDSFGVDIDSVPLEATLQNQNFQSEPEVADAVSCQTPVVPSNPVISAQPVIYPTQSAINPISALFSAQVAAQNFLYLYTQQQLEQQRQMLAAAMVTSLAAIPKPLVYFPPTKLIQPQITSTAPTSSKEVSIDSSEFGGHVTQYGAYGILRSCPLDVFETQEGFDKDGNADGELPIYTTPEDYRSRLQNWMPPRPPLGLLLRKQTLICVVTAPIQSKLHEITMRKNSVAKAPLNIDYVAALETVVEKQAKVKVTYVFNRISRLSVNAQSYFLQGFEAFVDSKCTDSPENVPSNTTSEPSRNLELHSNSTSDPAKSPGLEPASHINDAALDVEEVALCEVRFEVDSICQERSRAMYICDLLIGDVLICQALADCKIQAKICACRQALRLLSKPAFVVGGIRTWYDRESSPVDYLTFCLSREANQVPRLMPYLADPLASIPSDQPICPDDPAENFKICTPKPIHDLWLYTARPIAIDADKVLTPEQYLAQSAEFSQMTVNFEMEFDSSTGEFTAFGLVDAQRCVKANGMSAPLTRAHTASLLLQYLKLSQPVVGLLLPPPDPEDVEDLRMASEDAMNPLWGLTEASIVDSLMWGKHEKQFALPIEHLEAHCEVFASSNINELDESFASAGNSFFSSRRHLDQYLEAYAASALVAPLRVSLRALPHSLWHLARNTAHSWGLLTLIEFEIPDDLNTAFLLICKRVPLPRLKRTLFEKTEVGVFYLLCKGNLSSDALKEMSSADLLESPSTPEPQPVNSLPEILSPRIEDDAPYVDESDPLTRMARTFHATSILKAEATDAQQQSIADADVFLVSAELNQPSNAIEILDDLPKQLIPGIDY